MRDEALTDEEWALVQELRPSSPTLLIAGVSLYCSRDGSYSMRIDESDDAPWLVVWQLDDGAWEVGDPDDPTFEAPRRFPTSRATLAWSFEYLRAIDAMRRLASEKG